MNKKLIEAIQASYPNIHIVMASKYLETLADFKPFLENDFYHFGENRVEAILEKQLFLKDYPIKWHFIGTLQTKKVKKIINDIDTLHSLDRYKLAEEIEKRREKVLPCYIQVNISDETSKHGLDSHEVESFVDSIKDFKKIKVIGLMGMAAETSDHALIKKQFTKLKELRDTLNKKYKDINGLSIGMSSDYQIALEVGATVLRLGRILLSEGS
ncbi:MAG: YggS family pyridoxal phosphate-dependent enzyme [Candidatus Izemoplasmataceae bacterium]